MITLTLLVILRIQGHKFSECNKKFLFASFLIDLLGFSNFVYHITNSVT